MNCPSIKTWLTSLTIGLILASGCSKKTEPKETVLATIGDKTITVNEFRKRTELTVRPNYAAAGNQDDKAIALNNLVYEKIFASEAGDRSPLVQNQNFKNYIQGIKEQTMRKQLYERVAANTVRIDSGEIDPRFQLSKREYHLAYFSMNEQIAVQIAHRIKQDPAQRDSVFDELKSQMGKTFEKDVKWKDPEADPIHEALFSRTLSKNQILGPINTDDGHALFLKVLDWKDQPVIGPEDNAIRREEVIEKLKMLKAKKLWNEYKYDLMKGKEIEFNETTLKRVLQMFGDQFSAVAKIKRNPNPDNQAMNDVSRSFNETLNTMVDLPFFKIGKESWTIGDFKKALDSHPLVYRQKFGPREFPRQFQRAIVDLVCDSYLNKEAAKRSLDKNPVVVREVNMWKDADLSLYYYQDYLKTHSPFHPGVIDSAKAMNDMADALIDSLKQHYADRIQINMAEFDKIKLNRTPFVAYELNVPYPFAVPSFPNITRDAKLDFKRRRNHESQAGSER